MLLYLLISLTQYSIFLCASKILRCLTYLYVLYRSSKVAENLAKDVKDTYEFISDMLEDLLATQNDEDLIADALMMPAE